MRDQLNEYPDFGTDDSLPWEPDYQPIVIVPFPNMRCFGKPLPSLTSNQLLAVRYEAYRRNGKEGTYFQPLIEQIDAVLMEREGE